MLKTIKTLTVISCLAITLQACHENDDNDDVAAAPRQLANINTAVYSAIRQNPAANALFASTGATNVGDEPCDVKLHRMVYGTVDGTGKSVTSSGAFMLPHGDDPRCSGERPVLLYAHGTTAEKNYDLSQFINDPTNPAASEASLILAAYAAQGFAVIAPNYAGYADSSSDYHPYVDRMQQATEMVDALGHVRRYAGVLHADLSSDLFISGLSQGGYVAMAAHQVLEASGEKVTASLPVSGPYAILDFVDTIIAGYVNGGATTFAPMYLTALERRADIYENPDEVFAAPYATSAENALPAEGGFASSGFPEFAIFSGEPPPGANGLNMLGFGEDHLLSDTFRATYLADAQANPLEPVYKIRAEVKKDDLRDWRPGAPMLMCGASNDPVVYHQNSDLMAAYWSDLVGAGLVANLDLTDEPVGPFAAVMQAFQNSGLEGGAIHSGTGSFCALAGLGYFSQILAQQNSESLETTSN